MSNKFQNGRVINLGNKSYSRPELYENLDNKVQNNFEEEMMTGIYEPTTLNKLYFSKANLNIVHDIIRYTVYNNTNEKYIIGKQSDIDIQIIMRSMFLQHSPNLENNITKQIEFLNNKVVEWVVPKIIVEIEQYFGYLNSVQYLPDPIDRPTNMSSKGERTLKSVTTTF